jgi:hypothetical protein
MMLANRHYVASDGYRFGFQGQEGDDEWNGEGSMLAFKYRIHDARLGRFLSVDPLSDSYPSNSCYAFSENRVIDGVELEGLEYLRRGDALIFVTGGRTVIHPENASQIVKNMGSMGYSIGQVPFFFDPSSGRLRNYMAIPGSQASRGWIPQGKGFGKEQVCSETIKYSDEEFYNYPTRSTGQRPVGPTWNSNPSGLQWKQGASAAAAPALAWEAIVGGAMYLFETEMNEQRGTLLPKAIEIANWGLAMNLIPTSMQNTDAMSGLVQYLLNGETGFEITDPGLHDDLTAVGEKLWSNREIALKSGLGQQAKAVPIYFPAQSGTFDTGDNFLKPERTSVRLQLPSNYHANVPIQPTKSYVRPTIIKQQ